MKRFTLITTLLLAACADDPETCESAMPQFYAAGCEARAEPYRNMPVDEDTAIEQCVSASRGVSDACAAAWQSYVDCYANEQGIADFGCDVCRELIYRDWVACEMDQR